MKPSRVAQAWLALLGKPPVYSFGGDPAGRLMISGRYASFYNCRFDRVVEFRTNKGVAITACILDNPVFHDGSPFDTANGNLIRVCPPREV